MTKEKRILTRDQQWREQQERTTQGIEQFVELLKPGKARDAIAKLAAVARRQSHPDNHRTIRGCLL